MIQLIKYIFLLSVCAYFFSQQVFPSDYNAKVLWASKLIGFSSEHSNAQNSALQVLGKPSIMTNFGKSPCAWMPNTNSGARSEWIQVGFDSLINVQQIAIHENFHPGNITYVYLYDESNIEHMVYSNLNTSWMPENGVMKNIFIERTPYKVSSVKIVIKRNVMIDGQQQIDAIAIADTLEPIKTIINTSDESNSALPENLGSNINSPYSELTPIITPDGNTLYFTRDGHPDNIGPAKKQDVWISYRKADKGFSPAKNIGPPINNAGNNFVLSITPDGNEMLLGNIYEPDGSMGKGLSLCLNKEQGWSAPAKLEIKNFYNRNDDIGGAFLANNGKILFMSLERDDSYGGLDIYYSELLDSNNWSEPINLGPNINTAGDDVAPFLASDNQTLYYSTPCHCGYGENDLFITHRLDSSWRHWSEPENLGNRINTSGWDAYYTIPASGDYAYFVSSKNSLGRDDIFRIKLPDKYKPKPVLLVSGKVYNAKTKQPIGAKIIYELLPIGTEVGIAHSNPVTGDYKIVLPSGFKYGFLAVSNGFIAINEHLDLQKFEKYSEITRDLYLVPIEEGQVIRLNNIFFDFDKYDLLVDSYSELNRVVKFLNDNPDFNIEISGHTDSKGTNAYNITLSTNRAKAVGDYLLSKGIDQSRFTTKGYGKSMPVVKNDTDEHRRMNRRVEFKLLKKAEK